MEFDKFMECVIFIVDEFIRIVKFIGIFGKGIFVVDEFILIIGIRL